MEQWFVKDSCCDITTYNKDNYKPIYRHMNTNESVATNINSLSLSDRYTIARILVFKMYEPIQTNNGCYVLFDNIDKDTINEICNSLQTKLSSHYLNCLFVCSFFHTMYIQ